MASSGPLRTCLCRGQQLVHCVLKYKFIVKKDTPNDITFEEWERNNELKSDVNIIKSHEEENNNGILKD